MQIDSAADSESELSEQSGSEQSEQSEQSETSSEKTRAFADSQKRTKGIVPFEAVNIPKSDGAVERLLAVRNPDELLVKFRHASFHHCVWTPRHVLESDKTLRTRVRRFYERTPPQYSHDEPFNPAYLVVDRVIDDGELDGELHYLVKWAAQSYDLSTWETAVFLLQLAPDRIDDFVQRRLFPADKRTVHSLAVRNPSAWRQLPESPVFRAAHSLRSYQLEGLNWLMYCWHNSQNSILADEMGLGKTIQSTAFLNQLHLEGVKGPFLVVVPLSTMGNWEREIRTWTTLNAVTFHGNATCRNLIIDTEFYYRNADGSPIPSIYKFDIILTTYEMTMSAVAQLKPIKWRCVVLDEAHRLKNKSSKVSEHLKSYSMEHIVLLTGTPLQNSLDELWALLNFLDPAKFPSEKDFIGEYGAMTLAADVQRLQLLIKPLMLRRLKEDVEKSIPVKEETIVEVELTTTQKKWYRSILEKNFSWLKQGTKRANVPNLINTMIELRKCCIHPWLLKGAEDQILEELNARTAEEQAKALVQSSGKMVLIDKLLRKLKKGGHKVLIFSQMTKCLDLIQDYLRAQSWIYERIDGGVRTDLRQAAIDRFSAEGSESFVFLLCTRAGGVGINLTAADTCIIFDSDWNPQNDLQAQSRCHRIGQKKTVKIYRLVTRNTYEREMFDRASMKLGLDKAVLGRIDTSGNGEDDLSSSTSKQPALSKNDIEMLLKKGAYGAFMDDESSNRFCEEDIDQILERRTMVIRHDKTEQTGSMFSKASFQADNSHDVNVNDPDFWDKVAKQAQLEIVDEIPIELTMEHPRNRKTRNKFTHDGEFSDDDRDRPSTVSRPPDMKPWTPTERTRLEREMMQHGYGNWEVIKQGHTRRSIGHLRYASRWFLLRGLQVATLDKETVRDVRRQLAMYPIPSNPEEASADFIVLTPEMEDLELVPLEVPESDIPFPGCADKEEMNTEYIEQIDRKAKNLLIRVALMYNIRHRFKPSPTMTIPKMMGSLPAVWWGDQEDRDLMIGICKYGYLQYAKIWADQELCFYERFHTNIPEGSATSDSLITEIRTVNHEDAEDDLNDIFGDDELAFDEVMVDDFAKEEVLETTNLVQTGAFAIPCATDLGIRIRRICHALTKHHATINRKLEFTIPKSRDEKVNPQKNADYFTKRQKLEFQRVLVSYGLVRKSIEPVLYDWDIFRGLADLVGKSDEAMNQYYQKLVMVATETCHPRSTPGIPSAGTVTVPSEQDGLNEDHETLSLDRSKKILRRVSYFHKLRIVIQDPDLSTHIFALQKLGRGSMPKWWTPEFDIPLLYGLARYGCSRSDLIIQEYDLPFLEVYHQFQLSPEERLEQNIDDDEWKERFDEKFWMRESASIKRMEQLVNAAMRSSGRNSRAENDHYLDGESSEEEDLDESILAPKLPRFKLKVNPKVFVADAASSVATDPQMYDVEMKDDADGWDTDDMLREASERIKKKPKLQAAAESFNAAV